MDTVFHPYKDHEAANCVYSLSSGYIPLRLLYGALCSKMPGKDDLHSCLNNSPCCSNAKHNAINNNKKSLFQGIFYRFNSHCFTATECKMFF